MDEKTKQLVEEARAKLSHDTDYMYSRTSADSDHSGALALCRAIRERDAADQAWDALAVARLKTINEQDGRIAELEEDAEACAEYEALALRSIGEEVIAGRHHEARGELPYWISEIHVHYKKKLAEHDKRARHAEQERDCRDQYIEELKLERDEQTTKWMQAQSALDAEKESHRRTMSELGVEKDRVAKLEAKLQDQTIELNELRSIVGDENN
jgi:hypothetical protein